MRIESRPWKPQDLIDDLQQMIDEESDSYLNPRYSTLCMARDYLKEYFAKQENKPLTLEELRKMDGEQVWLDHTDGNEDCNGWARVELSAPWKPGGLKPHVFVVSPNCGRDYAGLLLECGVKIYRYKPDGVS